MEHRSIALYTHTRCETPLKWLNVKEKCCYCLHVCAFLLMVLGSNVFPMLPEAPCAFMFLSTFGKCQHSTIITAGFTCLIENASSCLSSRPWAFCLSGNHREKYIVVMKSLERSQDPWSSFFLIAEILAYFHLLWRHFDVVVSRIVKFCCDKAGRIVRGCLNSAIPPTTSQSF